jgi:hypothetical protein
MADEESAAQASVTMDENGVAAKDLVKQGIVAGAAMMIHTFS